MAETFNGRKRIRKQFGSIAEVAEMPNLIEVQKSSYDDFLMVKEPPGGRADQGLQAVFKSVFPISDFSGRATLEFVRYEFEPPKYDVDECQQRDMTFAAPLKVKLRLIVFDVNEETGAKSIKDVKEQDVYMGDMPFMTLERHLHHQRHRARHRLPDAPLAGRVLRPRQGQDARLGQAPVRRPHHPLSRLLARLRVRRQGHRLRAHRPAPQAAGDDAALCARPRRRGDPVDVLQDDRRQGEQARLEGAVRRREDARHDADGRPDRRQVGRGGRQGRREDHRAGARASWPRSGLKEVLFSAEDLAGSTWPRTSSTWRPARSTARPATSSTPSCSTTLQEAKIKEFPILDIDHVTVGAFIRNTLNVDKNSNQRGSADGHLPGHAPGRAADARRGDQRCSTACSSTPSATTSPRSAASR